MTIQFPGRVNHMNPAGIEQAAQTAEWNALRTQGERDRQAQTNKQFDDQTRLDNTRWGLAATKLGMDAGAEWVRQNWGAFADQMAQRGMVSPEDLPNPMELDDDTLMEGFKNLHESFRIGYAGAQDKDREGWTADEKNFSTFQSLTPEQREMWLQVKRNQPGLELKKVPMPDGRERVIIWDGQRGIGYGFDGQPYTAGIEGTAGEGTTPQRDIDFGVGPDPVQQAAEIEEAKYLAKLGIDDERAHEEGLRTIASGIRDAQLAITNIDNAIGAANWWSTGVPGQVLKNIGATDARELYNYLSPVLAALAFDRLQQMRDASKTGGALGQVSERELDLLMKARYAIDQATDPETLIRELMNARGHYEKVLQIHDAQMLIKTGQAEFAETVEEAMQYPSGTLVINPDGRRFTVP